MQITQQPLSPPSTGPNANLVTALHATLVALSYQLPSDLMAITTPSISLQ